MRGKVGTDVTPEQGNEAARLTALSIIASLQDELGDLDRVTGWVKAARPGQLRAGVQRDTRSDQRVQRPGHRALGTDAGRHARSAIGVAELPFDMSVEVEAIVEVS